MNGYGMIIKEELKSLRNKLRNLVKGYNICGLKGGTEIEDLSFEEIILLQNICCDIVPLTIKIGGPEARNDIRFLLKHGIDGVLAPMVETPYSFHNYMNTIESMSVFRHNSFSIIGLNIETITAFGNQDAFEKDKLYPFLTNITVGRSDLSSSMGLDPDDCRILDMTKTIVAKAKKSNKITSVGGKINIDNIEKIRNEIAPHLINTRHVCITLDNRASGKYLRKTILAVLQFEISLFRLFSKIQPDKKKFYEKRIQITLERMSPAKNQMSA